MNHKAKKFLVILLLVFIIGGGAVYLFQHKVKTVNIPPKSGIPITTTSESKGEIVPYLKVPAGFKITYFAKDLPGARVMALDPVGRILVSQTKEGKISVVVAGEGGVEYTSARKVLLDGIKNPHGLAFDCPQPGDYCYLYVATSDQLLRYTYNFVEQVSATNKEILASLPYSATDNHFTRTLMFLPPPNEDTLLISVGSSCNVCNEKDASEVPGHAKILAYNTKSGLLEEYASGLRNSVFMTLHPVSGKVFATEMGRDALGDDIPPDEINIIEKGKDYGWPNCYGKNIHDTNFDKNTYIRNPCMEPFEIPSHVDLQAHSAPLGLGFIPEEGWDESLWYNLLVSYHGSWNRSVPTGYKVERLKVDAKGKYLGGEDFITGFLSNGKKNGRPVDIKVMPGGTAYISDDLAGVIYKLSRE